MSESPETRPNTSSNADAASETPAVQPWEASANAAPQNDARQPRRTRRQYEARPQGEVRPQTEVRQPSEALPQDGALPPLDAPHSSEPSSQAANVPEPENPAPDNRAEEVLTQKQLTQKLLESFVPGRGTWASFLAILLVFIVLIGLLLHSVANRAIFQSPEYQLTREQIQVRFLAPDGSCSDQQPAWIPQNIREDLLNNVRQFNPTLTEPFDLLDPNVIRYFYDACKNCPRVRNVIKIQKLRPAKLEILVELHRPVLMVTVERDGKTACFVANEDGLLQPLPDGRILYEQHYPIPMLEGYHKEPLGLTPGSKWPDNMVRDAASIAQAFGACWEKTGIETIKVISSPKTHSTSYELIARNGTTIYWGTAEDASAANGFSNQQKVEALRNQFPDGVISSGEPQSISFQKKDEMNTQKAEKEGGASLSEE